MAKPNLKLVLLKTVVLQGKHFWPGSVVEWNAAVAYDLIDRQAAELCRDVSLFPGGDDTPGSGAIEEDE